MKYAGMPAGMWLLFSGSFRKQLGSVLEYDARTAGEITSKAKVKYREIIASVPEFEKGDRFKMNLVNCAIYTKFHLIHAHLRASFPPWLCFISVNDALHRLPPLSFARTKNPLRICTCFRRNLVLPCFKGDGTMNWPRIILDGVSMSLLFNAVVGVGFLLWPQAYSTMFPKEIKQAASPYVDKGEVRKMKLLLYPLYLVLFVYWAISACCAGMTGFWNLFWAGYVEMTLVSLSDFIILDCWLPGKVRHMIKGAEHCKAWERKVWLKTLAIPEHGLGWTLLVCPMTGLIVAGLGALIP